MNSQRPQSLLSIPWTFPENAIEWRNQLMKSRPFGFSCFRAVKMRSRDVIVALPRLMVLRWLPRPVTAAAWDLS